MKNSITAAVATCFVLMGAASQAATVNVSTVENNPVRTEFGIRANTGTIGSDLVGMDVTVAFDDNSSETLAWEQILNARSGVSTTDFSLLYAGRDWNMSTSRNVTSLEINVAPGNAVWDISPTEEVGDDSPGTLGGYSFVVQGGDPVIGEIDVTYSGSVFFDGAPRGIDTFTTMFVDFTGLEGGGVSGLFSFNSDLDSLEVAGDLTPIEVSAVPLPAGMPMLLAGMALLGLQRRRRNKS